jgi:hypothetical protein
METSKGRTARGRLAVLAVGVLMGLCHLIAGGPGFAAGDKSGTGIERNAICQTCDPPDDPPPTPRPTPTPTPPPPPPSFTTLMSRYTPYDINNDGRKEINSLKALFANPEPYYSTPNGVVLVLVDPKLVTDDPNIAINRAQMSLWLAIMGMDISAEGFFPYFIEASVYDGTVHQDGRTLLALRRFVKEVRSYYPVQGVLLVGSFPDAGIVRSVFVKANATGGDPNHPENLDHGSQQVFNHIGHFLALDSEYITPRAEVVLGDMDGNWESIYMEAPFSVNDYHALPVEPSDSYPFDGQVITTSMYRRTTRTYQDVFYIKDHQVSTWEDGFGSLRLILNSLEQPNPEISASDRLRPNRIARPELLVSRLDPKRVAINPVAPLDLDGKSPLDASGKPQTLRYSYPATLSWQRDRNLERRLIADYIARSHSFRLGSDSGKPFRTSSVRALDSGLISPGDFNARLRKASDSFASSTGKDNATLRDYIEWLTSASHTAVLRGIAAHSNGIISQFGATPHHLELELVTGGLDFATGSHVWRWVRKQQGAEWVLSPSFEGITENTDFHIYRTMWEFDAMHNAGQTFYVHEGCEVMRPWNAETVPYNDPTYGQMNFDGGVANGESLMFYGKGLGLMARNKVFNDAPAGFFETIKSTGRFGYGWRAYFIYDSGDAALNERTADPTVVQSGSDHRWRTLQRKRSYFWNIIGNPTLKIRY